MKRIYFDFAATTPVAKEVKNAMMPYHDKYFGNPSALYTEGQKARVAIENARKIVADFLGANQAEIIFTGSGTESNNTVIKGLAFSHLGEKKKHIITTKIEHPAILEVCKWLENRGFKTTYLEVNKEGLINLENLKKAITSETLLVSIMHVNNEIGVIQNIEEIGRICKEENVLFHTDAVQSFGKIPINVKKMNIDFLSASAHKIYGPKGVGILYLSKRIIEPLLHGGGHEFGVRSSTENVPGIVGLGKAVELCKNEISQESKRLSELRDKLIKGLLSIPDSRLNGHAIQRIYNNVNVSFAGIEGESILMQLDARGIAASTGSACSSKNLKASHVLLAIGLDHVTAHGSLRLTIGRYTKEKDIEDVIKYTREVVDNLREMSPLR